MFLGDMHRWVHKGECAHAVAFADGVGGELRRDISAVQRCCA